MIMDIRVYPDPVLRAGNEDVEVFDEDLKRFLKDMKDTMYEKDGVGLAAPQVGVNRKIAVVSFENREYVLINPKIVQTDGAQLGEEGCLSIPGVYEKVKRAERVVVEALDEDGNPVRLEAEGFLARAFAHEIDHLNGVLFIDHLSALKRSFVKKKLRQSRRES